MPVMKWMVLLILCLLLCSVIPKTTASATYPSTTSTIFQAVFDPVYWLNTFHSFDVNRQVRARWIKLLPGMITGKLRVGRIQWFDRGKRTSHNYI